jgi:MiaB/RimO family radical SAM methylthiotransferase
MRAYVGCVGCEQRQMDAERVRMFLQLNGYTVVEEPATSDLCILVTCAVDEHNETASLKALRGVAAAIRPQARLIVGGCLPSISPHKLADLEVSGTFSPRTMDSLDEVLGVPVRMRMREIKDPNRSVHDRASAPDKDRLTPREEYDRAKRGFKIRLNHGCLLSCSYCVIVNATGRLESVPHEDVIAAFKDGVNRGETTIMLVGGDSGAYGLDTGFTFANLLEQLLAVGGTHQVFIHDFNVNWLLRDMRDYARIFRKGSQRLRAMCLPVQSGSDDVLRRMRRPYKARDVVRALRWIRESAPHIALGTHMIAGFPGETEYDFEQSLGLLREVGFDFATCFRYSEHPRAPSACLEPKVSEAVKLNRLEQFHAFLGERGSILV